MDKVKKYENFVYIQQKHSLKDVLLVVANLNKIKKTS